MRKILSDTKKTYILFLVLAFLFYGNSIRNGFSFDDSYVTPVNTPLKGVEYKPNNEIVAMGIKGIPKIWQTHYGHGQGTAYDYRPVATTLFAIEYSLFGQSPHLNHFVSVLLYSLVVFYLFLILRLGLKEYPYHETFAFVCSLIFLAHPIHTEVVDNIKCTDELLAALFGFMAVYKSLVYFDTRRISHAVYAVVFLLLALYSKMTAALFVALIPLTLFFLSRTTWKQAAFVLLTFAICYFAYSKSKNVFIFEKEVRYFYHFENPLYTEKIGLFAKVLFALKTFGMYVKLLFVPYPLRFYYGAEMVPTHLNLLDMDIIIGVIFLVASVIFCYRSKSKIALYGLVFFLISMGPIVNLLQPVAGIIGERLCFIGTMGFAVFMTAVIFSFYKTIPVQLSLGSFSKKPLLVPMLILVLFLFSTWNRNTAWKDEITLFERDAPALERSAGANNLLANKYFDLLFRGTQKYSQSELVNKCIHHYNLVINTDSTVYSSFNNLGVVWYSFIGDVPKALNYFIRATRMQPDYPQAYENIGNCYDKLGNPNAALKAYRIAMSQDVKKHRPFLQTAKILLKEKRFKEAGKFLDITDQLFANDYALTIERGNYFYLTGQYENAVAKYEQAYHSKKTRALAESLINAYRKLGNNDKAAFLRQEAANLPL